MAKRELREYNEWFHSMLEARLEALTRAVQGTPGFQAWKADRTPESLESLGRWFEKRVEQRKRTPEEMEELRKEIPNWIHVPDEDLTDATIATSMDVGIYFAMVVLETMQGTRWDVQLKDRRDFYYGQPIISGFGKDALNPLWVLETVAYSIANGKPADLRGLYNTYRVVA
ncbi:MAG TPA: hypothetical protein VGB42_05880 [Candidatus Thermoplasmatota archaeon]